MDKKVALLRGINVGGKRKALMLDLKLLLEDIGFTNIITYIQSGNIIFGTKIKSTDIEIADKIERAIFDTFKFPVPVMIRSAEEMEWLVKNNPFYQRDKDTSRLYITFLKERPSRENCLKIASYDSKPDKFAIQNRDIFIFCQEKYHQSKLTNNFFERKLNVAATTRNWKTVLKLLELSR